ncbi:alpha-keto acid decarboxylase family protein [Natribacillus halophilus]|uniref:Alpha-keto-acid decarboxylase n=1 Tax=Natribacillus halophilus TaxID=549003 RepID=A0A1G8M936_9BACI|nr:thiamine pyrophosphate-binding protein [Natribacillus halophilus]SDI63870.1 indolepyruvate decarboxylase [Natribacillus halophilus]
MTVTVGEFLFQCLEREGMTEIFGVPGDFNFPLLDTLEGYEGIDLIDNRNELNAGYAADGYAHVKGMAALITTFDVGELSASNAIAGAYSENIPLIHIVGSPDSNDQKAERKIHHSLMNGDFDVFRKVHEHITAYAVKITADNAGIEIPRAIRIAKENKKPVYLDFPMDQVLEPVGPSKDEENEEGTDSEPLHAALEQAKQQLDQAGNTVLLVDFNTLRYDLESHVQALAEKMNVPVAQMLQGKSGFDEEHPQYIGMYAGALGDQDVRAKVEEADCIIAVGLLWSDFNMAKYTADLDTEKMIVVHPRSMAVAEREYENIYAVDALKALQEWDYREEGAVERITSIYDEVVGAPEEKLAAATYYPRFQNMLKQDDVMIIDTGTLSYGMSQVRLPSGALFISHGAWQSIGYATPAALGAAIAADERRVLLFIGEGALQFTVQELSSLIENGCKPIIFILNNQGYTIERYLNIDHPYADYNDIPRWDHMTLAAGFAGGRDLFKTEVRTNGELDEAIQQAEQYDGMSLVELIVTDPMDAPEYLHNLRENEKEG